MSSRKINFTLSAEIKRDKGFRSRLTRRRKSPLCAVLCTRDNDTIDESFLRSRTETIHGSFEPNWTDQFQIKLGPRETIFLHLYIFDTERIDKNPTHGKQLRLTASDQEQNSRYIGDDDNDYQNNTSQPKVNQPINKSIALIDSISRVDIGKILKKNPNGRIKLPMKNDKAYICINIEEDHSSIHKEFLKGFMRLHLRGLGIRNVEGGLLQGLSDPFFEIWRKHEVIPLKTSSSRFTLDDDEDYDAFRNMNTIVDDETNWIICYRSSHIENHVNPTWDPFEINLSILCGGDLRRQLKVMVYDWEEDGAHRLIGEAYTDPNQLMDRVCRKGNGDIEKSIKLFKNDVPQGSLVVLQAKLLTKNGRRSS